MSTPSISAIAATLRVQYGINSVRQMEQITTELLVNMPTEGAIGELEFGGDPTGLVVPQFSGQLLHDTENDTYYRSTGTDASDWVVIGGGSSGLSSGYFGIFTYGPTHSSGDIVITDSTTDVGYDLENQDDVTSYSFPNLTSIDPDSINDGNSTLWISDSALLVSISFPLLSVIPSANIHIADNPSLTTLSFPSLTELGGNVICGNNAFSVESVDAILAALVGIPSYGAGKTVALNGGTSASPSGVGGMMKAELISRGCTVNTN